MFLESVVYSDDYTVTDIDTWRRVLLFAGLSFIYNRTSAAMLLTSTYMQHSM